MLTERDGVEGEEGTSPRVQSLGRYRIIAELARGGMGIVYLALVRGPGAFNKLLVLKELKPALLNDPHLVAMFLEEARLAACLSHPNIVQTMEAGSEDGRHYIAMEYLSGQSLHRLMARAQKCGQAVPLSLQCSVLCAALEGLDYAHKAVDFDGRPLGMVHRDVSPHNILVSYDGQTKVLDFGIAKAMNSGVETLAGVIKGKLAYMAPEQAACAEVDASADIFSLGVILWEAVTARRFWSGVEGEGKILRALLLGESPLAREDAMAGVPPELQPVIAKATAFARAERYASAGHLLSDLRAALGQIGVRSLAGPEIGEFLQQLFAADRARLQAAIEETVGFYRGPTSGRFPAAEVPSFSPELGEVPSLNIATSERTPAAGAALSPKSTAHSTTQASYLEPEIEYVTPRPRPPIGSRVAWTFAAVALGLAVAEAALRWQAREPSAPSPAASLPSVAAAMPTDSSAPPERLLPANARVTVRASPKAARITIDGRLMPDNPWVGKLPRDGEAHTARVEAEGYVSREESFDTDDDTTLVIPLEPRKAPARMAAPVRAAAPPAAPIAAPASPSPADPSAEPGAPGSVPLRRINPLNPYAK